MLLDGHSASSVSKNLGINNTNLLYRWKSEILARSGPVARVLDDQVAELREELQREFSSVATREEASNVDEK